MCLTTSFCRKTEVSLHQKCKTRLDLIEARDNNYYFEKYNNKKQNKRLHKYYLLVLFMEQRMLQCCY